MRFFYKEEPHPKVYVALPCILVSALRIANTLLNSYRKGVLG